MIAAAEVDNLVKDIIAILQPLKVAVSKAKAEKMARSYIGKIDQLHRGVRVSRPVQRAPSTLNFLWLWRRQ
jgi:hypothetical protein